MARKFQTHAHWRARHDLFRCARCDRYLTNAQYLGEFTYAYDDSGGEKMTTVYMRCNRCDTITATSMDVTGDDDTRFYNRVEEVAAVPKAAKKITTAPLVAEIQE